MFGMTRIRRKLVEAKKTAKQAKHAKWHRKQRWHKMDSALLRTMER